MDAPVTVAVLLCPMCKDVWHHATAAFSWPRSAGRRAPQLVAYDCPNGCSLDDADKQPRPALAAVASGD